MRNRRGSTLMYLICFLMGVAVGGAAVGFWVQHRESEWVEAYGTWFAGISTAAALLWAVNTFRADQAHRQAQAEAEAAAAKAAIVERGRATREVASRVVIDLSGGAGEGDGAFMTSVNVKVHNDTAAVANLLSLELDPRLVPSVSLDLRTRVQPHDTWSQVIEIERIPCDRSMLSGGQLPGYWAQVDFLLLGREWQRRTGVDDVVPVSTNLP